MIQLRLRPARECRDGAAECASLWVLMLGPRQRQPVHGMFAACRGGSATATGAVAAGGHGAAEGGCAGALAAGKAAPQPARATQLKAALTLRQASSAPLSTGRLLLLC